MIKPGLECHFKPINILPTNYANTLDYELNIISSTIRLMLFNYSLPLFNILANNQYF